MAELSELTSIDVRYLTVRLHYMDWTPENYSPPFFRRLLPKETRLRFRGETEDSFLHKILCGSVATGHHGYTYFLLFLGQFLIILLITFSVSLKVAAFHEPDESQRRLKRSRVQLPHVEEDIEAPSLSGTTLDDPSPAESSSGVDFQPKLKDHLGKSPTNQSDAHAMATDSFTRRTLSATRQRSAREVKEASRLREMVSVVDSLLIEDG